MCAILLLFTTPNDILRRRLGAHLHNKNDKKVPIFKDLTINRQCSSVAAVLVEAKGSCYHYDNLYWTL